MEEFNELLRKVLDRRGTRREDGIANLRAFVQDALCHEEQIQHLRQENTEQWRTIRAMLADKKKLEKQLLELKHP